MLTPELEQLINYALEDGVLTDKERSVLMRKAQAAGADLDEFEMILDAKLHEVQKAAAVAAPKPNSNKHGEVRKCPACGAMVSAFTTQCSECGFEFNNVEANKSANTLFEKLQALEMEKAHELAQHEESKNKQLLALSERHNSGGTLTNDCVKPNEQSRVYSNFAMASNRTFKKILRRGDDRLSVSTWMRR